MIAFPHSRNSPFGGDCHGHSVPTAAADTQAQYHAVIELAAKIRDWQTLLFAVEDMIANQRDLVAWWNTNVTPGQSPGSNQWSNAGRHSTMSFDEAEHLTGSSSGKCDCGDWGEIHPPQSRREAGLPSLAVLRQQRRDDGEIPAALLRRIGQNALRLAAVPRHPTAAQRGLGRMRLWGLCCRLSSRR
jgi:hypothetical protein